MRYGTLLQPGDLIKYWILFIVSFKEFSDDISILFITTKTGTPNAIENPKCSLVVPALIRKTHQVTTSISKANFSVFF